MKKNTILTIIIVAILCLTGCNNSNVKSLNENIKKMELTGNLITHNAYYHNVVEYEKKAGTGITHLFEKNRKMFIEYTGTIKLGIDLTKVKVDVKGNEINVFIPKATIIGEPNVDKDDFEAKNFIESKEGINKNPITVDDASEAFDKAQKNMKENASKDNELLSLAQKRAKVILEENIKEFSKLNDNEYTINWEYGQ